MYLKCKNCGNELSVEREHVKTANSRLSCSRAEPVWPPLSELQTDYNTTAAATSEASLDVARYERKRQDAQSRYETNKAKRDALKRLITLHPES